MIIDRDFINEIVLIGIEEIEKMNNDKVQYKISLEHSNTNAVILKNKNRFMKEKRIFRKNSKMNFKLLYSNILYKDRKLLEEILYIPNGIDLQEIKYKYGIEEETSVLILAMLHELGHIKDMVSDVYDNKYLKRTHTNDLEYMVFKCNMNLLISRKEQMRKYKELQMEKTADEFSVRLFKENLEKFSILIKQLA